MIDRGYLGLLLMKCGYGYNEALELIDLLEGMAKKHGYVIQVEKLPDKA